MSSLLGGLGGAAIGIAVGEAGAAVIEPPLEAVSQEAWKNNQVKLLPLGQLAELVAQRLATLDHVTDDAARQGFHLDQLTAAVQLALKAPGVAEALTLYRRAAFDGVAPAVRETQLEHALAKAAIEQQYWPALKALVALPLESAQLAQGIHRGYIAYSAPGFIAPPDTPGKVPFYPQTKIDALATAAANGEDAEQLQVLVGIAGLPLSLFEMLELLNRGLVTEDDVKRAIANSNLQNQYMDVALDLRRRLLTPNEYAELYLRGWISQQAMYDGGALSGMEPGDMDLLYDQHGRPITVKQIQTAIERGGVYDDPMKEDTPGTLRAALVSELQTEGYSLSEAHAFVDSVQEGNIRSQFYRLDIANRYTYPSYFVIKPLVASGAITVDEATQIFKNEGWPPDLAAKAAASFAPSGAATTTPEVKSAKTKLLTKLHTLYVNGSATDAQATATLTAEQYPAATIQALLTTWGNEKSLVAATNQPLPVEPTT